MTAIETLRERLEISAFADDLFGENCYVVRPQSASSAVIVDPGDEADRILKALDALDVKTVEAILLTHTHFDHVGAVAPVAGATGAPVYCPELETPVLANIMDFVPWPGFGPYAISTTSCVSRESFPSRTSSCMAFTTIQLFVRWSTCRSSGWPVMIISGL